MDDGDSSEDEINVEQVIKTKTELDKVSLPPVYCLGCRHGLNSSGLDPQGP